MTSSIPLNLIYKKMANSSSVRKQGAIFNLYITLNCQCFKKEENRCHFFIRNV